MVGGLAGLVVAAVDVQSKRPVLPGTNDTAWFVTLALMLFSALLTVTLLAVYLVRQRRAHADVARRVTATQAEIAALRAELAGRQPV